MEGEQGSEHASSGVPGLANAFPVRCRKCGKAMDWVLANDREVEAQYEKIKEEEVKIMELPEWAKDTKFAPKFIKLSDGDNLVKFNTVGEPIVNSFGKDAIKFQATVKVGELEETGGLETGSIQLIQAIKRKMAGDDDFLTRWYNVHKTGEGTNTRYTLADAK